MIEMDLKIQSAGLSKNQSKVYSALVQSEQLSVSEIADKTELKRASVYSALSKLEKLRLVKHKSIGKRKKYVAADPQRIMDIATERYEDLRDTIPLISGLYHKSHYKPRVEMHHGIDAVKKLYEQAFSHIYMRGEVLWLSNVDILVREFPELLSIYNDYLDSTETPQIRELIVDSAIAEQWYAKIQRQLRRKAQKHQLRVLSSKSPFGATEVVVFNNTTALISLDTEIFVTFIHSKEITKTYKAMYEVLWRQSTQLS